MPSEIKPLFGTPGVDVPITLASLANNAARESTAWDWSAYEDVLVEVTVKGGAAPIAGGVVTVYAYATVDNGATYTEGATGVDALFTFLMATPPDVITPLPGVPDPRDAAFTMMAPTQLFCVGVLFVNAVGQVRKGGPWSLAALFGGTLPQKGGVVVVNESGDALDATGSNHHVQYQGVSRQIVAV